MGNYLYNSKFKDGLFHDEPPTEDEIEEPDCKYTKLKCKYSKFSSYSGSYSNQTSYCKIIPEDSFCSNCILIDKLDEMIKKCQ